MAKSFLQERREQTAMYDDRKRVEKKNQRSHEVVDTILSEWHKEQKEPTWAEIKETPFYKQNRL